MKGGIWLADGIAARGGNEGRGAKKEGQKRNNCKDKGREVEGSQQMSNFLSAVRGLTDCLLLVSSSARIFGCSGGGGVKVPSTSV